MAFLADDDKLLGNEDENQNQQTGAGSAGGGSSGFISGGSGSDVGSGGGSGNTGGVSGKGGSGGWTNIQAYLDANKQDTGTADYATQKLGGEFDKEKSSLDQSASAETAKANSQTDKINQAKGNYQSAISNAGQAYDWSGNQSQGYKDSLNPIKSAITDQYSGPKNFAYGFSDKTQKAKELAGDNNAFSSWLENSYQERAGKPMTGGQLSLQKQFDTTNDKLAGARENLLKQYSGLESYRDQKVKDTDAAFGKAAQDYGNAQNTLKSDLQNYGNTMDENTMKAESDARSAYGQGYYNQTGLDLSDPYGQKGYKDQTWNTLKADRDWWQNTLANTPAPSSSGGGLIWDPSQPQQSTSQLFYSPTGATASREKAQDYVARANEALNNYKGGQVSSYANAGDSQKKQYNAIMDLLNSNNRKQQGFDVSQG